jgi:hypothetical protein
MTCGFARLVVPDEAQVICSLAPRLAPRNPTDREPKTAATAAA